MTRAVFRRWLLIAACAGSTCATAQIVPGAGSDIELTGQAVGPLPMQPGVESRFVLTWRNLGPNPVPLQVVSDAPWPYDGPRLSILPQAQPAPPCATGYNGGGDPPIDYYLVVGAATSLPVGGRVTCTFTLTVDRPLPPEATLTFTAYQDFDIANLRDPDRTNNQVTFALGQPITISIPTIGTVGAMALASLLLLAASAARQRASGPRSTT